MPRRSPSQMLSSYSYLWFRSGSRGGIRLGSLLVEIRDEEQIEESRSFRDRFGPEFLQPCRVGRLGPWERWAVAARGRASDMWVAVDARCAGIGGQATGLGFADLVITSSGGSTTIAQGTDQITLDAVDDITADDFWFAVGA